MEQYPVNLNLKGERVLVVGGGKVACRKVKRLISCGALIRLVSPELNQDMRFLYQNYDKINFYHRKFDTQDLDSVFLVIAATDRPDVNEEIANLAHQKNLPVNVVDSVHLSNFTLPAVIDKGQLLITLSTGGNLPALSSKLRQNLEEEFGVEYDRFLKVMKKIRPKIIAKIDDPQERKQIFRKLADENIIKKFSDSRSDGLKKIKEIIGCKIELNLE